jgi:hypothetical protein
MARTRGPLGGRSTGRPARFSDKAPMRPPAPACACLGAQAKNPYSATAAGGAKMTRPILAGGPLEAPDALNALIPA